MTMQQLRSIVNDTAADAIDVSWNFGTIENQINTSLIDRDGTVAMTGQLTLLGAPTQALHAAPKQYVDAIQPVGMIVDYGGTAAPSGWLLCEGGVVDQSSYPALFAVVGTAFNTGGEGGTQFRLPDFRSRSAVHPSAVQVIGSTGGNADLKAHIHTMGTHNHTQNSHTHTMGTHIHTMGTHAHITDINHDHASFNTSSSGSHFHNGLSDPTFGTLGFTSGIDSGTGITGLGIGAAFTSITIADTSSNHVHPIDVPALGTNNKTSTSVDPGDTNATDPGDTNSTTATNNAVDPGDTNSTGAGTDNYHPYLLVKKIIKAV